MTERMLSCTVRLRRWRGKSEYVEKWNGRVGLGKEKVEAIAAVSARSLE